MANFSSKDLKQLMVRRGMPAAQKKRRAPDAGRVPLSVVPLGAFASRYQQDRFKPFLDPVCRRCGCSQLRPCPTGCHWTVKPDEPNGPVCNICAERGESLRVLCIDPSIGNFGWAVLDVAAKPKLHDRMVESGAWHPSKRPDIPDRFVQLSRFMAELLQHFMPTDVIVEMPHKGQRGVRSFDNLMVYSNTAGVTAGVAMAFNRRTWRIGVNTWKGREKKSATALTVALVTGKGETATEDEIDAIGLGLWFTSKIAPALLGLAPLALLPAPAF